MKLGRQRLFLSVMVLCFMMSETAAAEVYELAPVLVTATRYEQNDLEIPATTQVLSQQQIINTGATSIDGALKYTTGIIYKGSPTGEGGGEFLIRGKRRGTLVMVDGVSINFRNGYANLENIPVEDVERVEIIRGGGAVMYGSDAIGGVINIITKKNKSTSVTSAIGNFGRQHYGAQLGVGKLSVGVAYDKLGEVLNTTQPSIVTDPLDSKFFHYHGGEKYITTLTGNIGEYWRIRATYAMQEYGKSYHFANKIGQPRYDDRNVTTDEFQTALQYDRNGLSGTLSFHRYHSKTMFQYYEYQSRESENLIRVLDRKYRSESIDRMLSADIHKEWKVAHGTAVLGVGADRNFYDSSQENDPDFDKYGHFIKYGPRAVSDYVRNVYSLYGSYEHHLNAHHSVTLSGRQTWTAGSPGDKEFHEFTPQIQYLYHPKENVSFFASYGESFVLPTMIDLYGKGLDRGNADLKPETGKHYEFGVKYISGKTLWKMSLFESNVKNFMRLKTDKKGLNYAVNEDTRNQGIELSAEIKHGDRFSSDWGIVIQNPKFYDARYPEDGWQRDYGRVQLNGGITYHADKWTVSFNASYLGQRVLSSYQEVVDPMLMTAFHVSYMPNRNCEIFFDADNILDREYIISHVSSRYNAQPFNFLTGVTYHF